MPRRLLVLALAISLAAVTAAAAGAATGPGNQKSGIVAAMNALLGKDKSKVTYQGIKVTTIPDKAWAIASVVPKPAFQATFQSFYAVLIKVPDLKSKFHWIVADFGNAFVGCGVASLEVLKDITGDSDPCPAGAFG